MKLIVLALVIAIVTGCSIRVFSDGNNDTNREYLKYQTDKG